VLCEELNEIKTATPLAQSEGEQCEQKKKKLKKAAVIQTSSVCIHRGLEVINILV
jgi:hypothetical protein